ncbi:MAG: hypothetical protein C4295_02095 [Candidatus Fervidibacterota bacterium]
MLTMTTRQRKLGKRKGSQAFTLTELLVVLAIIAILMGLLIAFYSPSQEQRKVFECQNRLQVLHRALRLYMLDWDGFPASPYDSLDNDKDGRFDEDPPNGQDDDRDGKVDEDGVDAEVGGLLALDLYLRSKRALVCPSDNRAVGQLPDNYTSYQGCDVGTDFVPPPFPLTGSLQMTCQQDNGVPTYALTRFLPLDNCHPSSQNFLTNCNDPDRLRQLGVLNARPLAPNPALPDDQTVVTWCVHHRYIPNTTVPNYTKGGVPADLVLYFDGQVRIQQMTTSPDLAWRRKPEKP